jgi:hypothetical protein
MIRPEDIPPEVVEAVTALFEPGYLESIGLHPESIAATALNAWPGMDHLGDDYCQPRIVLPLPQKETSE